ncbi:MAG TPA: diaminopropionate ammonia-lyase [Candidatus Nanopelagicaceae bacterium]|nr:diaminopropionate ammonia-lyase [Candidatus Nanopelagicaceae bacterium]
MREIKCFHNKNARDFLVEKSSVKFMSKEIVNSVRNFHKKFSHYKPTPPESLDNMANKLNIKKIWIKDESFRFGLNAFKVLGGSYAIGVYLSRKLGIDINKLSFEKLKSPEYKKKIGDITFVTATDGNHGRGVAWAARELNQSAVVFMPKGSSKHRVDNIRKENAKVIVTEKYYDATVKMAAEFAQKNGVLIQDTSWEDYTEIPTWIMQGYATLIDEVLEELKKEGESALTHIFLQAGVGSLAAGIQAYLMSKFSINRPITLIIEPNNAACLYKSALIGDTKPHVVDGNLSTIMAGLACGKPSLIAWNILRDYSDYFISCSDRISENGMRMFAKPLLGDPKIVSGESGAVGLGLLIEILNNDLYNDLKESLGLSEDSRVLIFSTEGDTDPDHYREIVMDEDQITL